MDLIMTGHDYIVWRDKNLKNSRKEQQRKNINWGNCRERQIFKVHHMIEYSSNYSLCEILVGEENMEYLCGIFELVGDVK